MGYLPARTHGWDATMSEYDRKSEVYEYGYHVGHRALFSLRPGESFVREAGNRGLHVNMDADPSWDGLKARAPRTTWSTSRSSSPATAAAWPPTASTDMRRASPRGDLAPRLRGLR